MEEYTRTFRAVGMNKQGSWLNWEDSPEEINMEWNLVNGTPKAAIPIEIWAWRAAYSNNPGNMGDDRGPIWSARFAEGEVTLNRTIFACSGFDGRVVQMAT